MFDQWPIWLSKSPVVRRQVIKLWRVLLRIQRATLAKAVLVLRKSDDQVLLLRLPSGALQLPVKELDGWVAIDTQVEAWLDQMLQEHAKPSLIAIDGTPAREGVTFLYAARAQSLSAEAVDQIWLAPDVAAMSLSYDDSRLLSLCLDCTS